MTFTDQNLLEQYSLHSLCGSVWYPASLYSCGVCRGWPLLCYLTHVTWFLTDDAFISFRYACNLLEGHGLVFNPGEYVKGHSNFLWVLELSALRGTFGLRPNKPPLGCRSLARWVLSPRCYGG